MLDCVSMDSTGLRSLNNPESINFSENAVLCGSVEYPDAAANLLDEVVIVR